ncbi:hypothetical protein FZ942_08280 [Azospirillum lipoferum]|uniref:GGDEF domain-containing protein n=1 Tax=Azospirillum lipoferum TaxID=193 RepID=A0A5A9GTF0_AZOLI|nr:hypothetical protein FZ942_08280 [Azospirillum lipoferum]
MSIDSVRRLLRRWFRQAEATVPPRAPAAVQRPAGDGRPGASVPEPHRLEQRLWRLLMQPAIASTGRVHLIDLSMMRECLGVNWPILRQRVFAAADTLIDRSLTRNDISFRTSADDYVLVFASLDRHAAALVCARIAQELLQLFLGDDRLADIRVSTAVGVVDGHIQFEHSFAKVLMASARPQADRRTGDRTVSATTATAAGDGSPPMPAPLAYAGEGEGKTPLVLRQLKLSPDDSGRFGVKYRPVWDIGQMVISTYMGVPVRSFPDGSFAEGAAALNSVTDAVEILKLDADALVGSVEILHGLFRSKSRLLMSVPVCFDTLAARRTRQPFLEICQSIPDYLRRFLIFELLRFPPGVPTGRLSELLHEVRPYCRWSFMQMDFRQQSFSSLAGTGLSGITMAMPGDRSAEPRLMEEMNAIVTLAERAGLMICVTGLSTTSMVVAARAAGVRLVAGNRIGLPQDRPRAMKRLDWPNLYREDDEGDGQGGS